MRDKPSYMVDIADTLHPSDLNLVTKQINIRLFVVISPTRQELKHGDIGTKLRCL